MLPDKLSNLNSSPICQENISDFNGNISLNHTQKENKNLIPTISKMVLTQQLNLVPNNPLDKIRSLSGVQPPKFSFKGGEVTFLTRIKNAHLDDIHGLIKLGHDSIVSGSKDSTVRIWNVQDRSHEEIGPGKRGYASWITSLANLDDNHFAFGSRDGYLTIVDRTGDVLSSLKSSRTASSNSGCKERNEERINCISAPSSDDIPSYLYVGKPQYLEIYDRTKQTFVRSIKAHIKDWVYAILPFNAQKVVVAVGSQLELWKMGNTSHSCDVLIPRLNFSEKSPYKPFITHLCPLKDQPGTMAVAYFDGDFKIYSMESQTEKTFSDAHKGRIWSCLSFDANLLLTSADDKMVCLWDLRMKKTIAKITQFPGRVSSLLGLDERMFATASCPDDVFTSQNKAEIQFFDLRKV